MQRVGLKKALAQAARSINVQICTHKHAYMDISLCVCISFFIFGIFWSAKYFYSNAAHCAPKFSSHNYRAVAVVVAVADDVRAASCERRAQSDYAPLASALFCSFASRILQETLTHLGRVCWYPNLAQAIAATSKFRFQMDRAADKKKPNGKQNQQDYCNFLSARVARLWLWLWPFLCEANCHKLSSLRLQTRETCRVL